MWVFILVSIPWLLYALFTWSNPNQLHVGFSEQQMFWWRISFVDGGILCVVALWLFLTGLRERQFNLLLVIFSLAGFWFLFKWSRSALLGILRAWHFIT
jgi:hypothetical protein